MYDVVKELQLSVEKNYAVAVDNIEAHSRIQNVVDIKRDDIRKNGFAKACSELSKDLSIHFKHQRSHLSSPFPNYSFTVVLETKDYGNIYVEETIELRISLLCEYYTVFCKRNTVHRDILHDNLDIFPVSQSVISTGSSNDLNQIKLLIEKNFISQKFVNISLLLKYMISDYLPFGVEGKAIGDKYPVYDFLFDRSIGLGNYVLAKNQ